MQDYYMETFPPPDVTVVAAASLWTGSVHASEISGPPGVVAKLGEHEGSAGPVEASSQGLTESTEKPAAGETDWKCPRCLVVNGAHEIRCPCCEGPKPGHESAATGLSFPTEVASSAFQASSSPNGQGFSLGSSGEGLGAQGRRSEGFVPDPSAFSSDSPSVFFSPASSSGNQTSTVFPTVASSDDSSTSTIQFTGQVKRPSGFIPVLPPSSPSSSLPEQQQQENQGDSMLSPTSQDVTSPQQEQEIVEIPSSTQVLKRPEESTRFRVPAARVFMFGSGELDQMPFWSEEDNIGETNEDDREVTRPRVVKQLEGKSIVRAASGAMHSAVLTADGQCWTFGCSDGGVLGRGDGNQVSSHPACVDIPGCVVATACGDSHTAFLTRQGELFLCGCYRDSYGALGFPNFVNAGSGAYGSSAPSSLPQSATPMLVFSGLSRPRISAIACGENHTLALEYGGEAFYVWGSNEFGQLGFSSSSSRASMAQAQASASTTNDADDPEGGKEIASDSDDDGSLQAKLSLLVPRRRTVEELQLREASSEEGSTPTSYVISNVFCGRCTSFLQIANKSEVQGVNEKGEKQAAEYACDSRSNGISCERDDGTGRGRGSFILGCGRNSQGEVGCGVAQEGSIVAKFVKVDALKDVGVKYLTGGQFFSVALTVDGLVYTWGQAEFTGQGASSSPTVETPTVVESLRSQPVTWVQCGSDHCLAVTAAGCLYTWGAGQNYQLGNEKDVMFRRRPFLVNSDFFDGYAVLQAYGGSQHSMVLVWDGTYAQPSSELMVSDEQKVAGKRPPAEDGEEAEREVKRIRPSSPSAEESGMDRISRSPVPQAEEARAHDDAKVSPPGLPDRGDEKELQSEGRKEGEETEGEKDGSAGAEERKVSKKGTSADGEVAMDEVKSESSPRGEGTEVGGGEEEHKVSKELARSPEEVGEEAEEEVERDNAEGQESKIDEEQVAGKSEGRVSDQEDMVAGERTSTDTSQAVQEKNVNGEGGLEADNDTEEKEKVEREHRPATAGSRTTGSRRPSAGGSSRVREKKASSRQETSGKETGHKKTSKKAAPPPAKETKATPQATTDEEKSRRDDDDESVDVEVDLGGDVASLDESESTSKEEQRSGRTSRDAMSEDRQAASSSRGRGPTPKREQKRGRTPLGPRQSYRPPSSKSPASRPGVRRRASEKKDERAGPSPRGAAGRGGSRGGGPEKKVARKKPGPSPRAASAPPPSKKIAGKSGTPAESAAAPADTKKAEPKNRQQKKAEAKKANEEDMTKRPQQRATTPGGGGRRSARGTPVASKPTGEDKTTGKPHTTPPAKRSAESKQGAAAVPPAGQKDAKKEEGEGHQERGKKTATPRGSRANTPAGRSRTPAPAKPTPKRAETVVKKTIEKKKTPTSAIAAAPKKAVAKKGPAPRKEAPRVRTRRPSSR